MSALPPKADNCSATTDVHFGPVADSCTAADSILFRLPRRRWWASIRRCRRTEIACFPAVSNDASIRPGSRRIREIPDPSPISHALGSKDTFRLFAGTGRYRSCATIASSLSLRVQHAWATS